MTSHVAKKRKIETTLVKLPQSFKSFSLTIDSSRYVDSNHSNIDFKFFPTEEDNFFRNGALNLSGGDSWEVALSRLMMPNNIISFPSLSADANLNSAYIAFSFILEYTIDKKKKIEKTIQVPYFFEHKKYTVPLLIKDMKKGIRSIFTYICNPNKNGLIIACDIFLSACFHIFIDPQSKYVKIKRFESDEKNINPFFKCFDSFFKKTDFLPDDAKNVVLKGVNLFASYYIINFMGKFDFSVFQNSQQHSQIFEKIKLDQLIFEHMNEPKTKKILISSSIPYKINELSLLKFKTTLTHHSQESEYSTIAALSIPKSQEEAINYEPINPIYHPMKKCEVREIGFLLTDGINEKLNLTNGSVHFTLNFRTRECDKIT